MVEWLDATSGITNWQMLVMLMGILGLVITLTIVVFK